MIVLYILCYFWRNKQNSYAALDNCAQHWSRDSMLPAGNTKLCLSNNYLTGGVFSQQLLKIVFYPPERNIKTVKSPYPIALS